MTERARNTESNGQQEAVQALDVRQAPPSNVIIHIGRHKAASTFLQHEFFPQLTRNLCIDKGELFHLLGEQEFSAARFRQFVASNLRQFKGTECLNSDRDDLLILSREGLSFPPMDADIERYATNLRRSYPDARVICIIREQFDLLTTLYVWHTCKKFLTGSLDSYVRGLMTSSGAGYLLHNEVVRTYMNAFGKDRVLVLPYELLVRQHSAFLRQIVDFIDPQLDYRNPPDRLNVSYKKRAVIRGVIAFNVLVHAFFLVPHHLLGKAGFVAEGPLFRQLEYRLKKFSRKKLSSVLDRLAPNGLDAGLAAENFEAYGELFAQTNGEIESLTGLDLATYGYITPENMEAFVREHGRGSR